MKPTLTLDLADADATEALGGRLAAYLQANAVVHLHGDLGAGKTTLVRGLLHSLGHVGAVKSPTYTLIEPYKLGNRRILHCDLYRVADPEELDYLGLREALGEALLLIEWPERGTGWLPRADLDIRLRYQPSGRQAIIETHSDGLRPIDRLLQNRHEHI